MSFYLDYNSTSPLAKKVIKSLENYPYANSSSTHALGRESLKKVKEVKSYLYELFSLNQKDFDIVFHSGATEASATFLRGHEFLIYGLIDHPCVLSQAEFYKDKSRTYNVLGSGKIDISHLESILKENSAKGTILNITWVHNETGVVQNLDEILKLKVKYKFLIHVDAVQLIGKASFNNTNLLACDVLTFSGHKFGALKGIGFSFVKKGFNFNPLITGGGQQEGLRSGTLNTHGILSIKDALSEVDFSLISLKEFKSKLVTLISKNTNITIIPSESSNTICFYHHEKKADEMLIHFDMNKLCVSSGSACSSGSVEPSATLVAMGLKEYSKNSIRVSIGKENLEQIEEILKRLEKVISRL